jgi:hypothetical protein
LFLPDPNLGYPNSSSCSEHFAEIKSETISPYKQTSQLQLSQLKARSKGLWLRLDWEKLAMLWGAAPGEKKADSQGKWLLQLVLQGCLSPAKALRERVALKLDDHQHDSCAASACQYLEKPPFALIGTYSERFVGK